MEVDSSSRLVAIGQYSVGPLADLHREVLLTAYTWMPLLQLLFNFHSG